MMFEGLKFRSWSQPVVSRPWGVVTVLLWYASAATGMRSFNHAQHLAWERAVGVR